VIDAAPDSGPDPSAARVISVLTCRTTDLDAQARGALRDLAEAQSLQAAARLERESDRDSLLTAHLAARVLVAEGAGVPVDTVALERRCPQCGSDVHGVPSARGPFGRWFLSISHTGGFAAAAASAAMPIGIDAEAMQDHAVWKSVATTVFSARERETVLGDESGLVGRRLWARKEAIAKLWGLGLNLELKSVDVSEVTDDWARTTHGWVRSLPAPTEVALALAAPRAAVVNLHDSLPVASLVARARMLDTATTSSAAA
jgi:4'-phosphopantetheinyl transferase